jgi:hypothetical protein
MVGNNLIQLTILYYNSLYNKIFNSGASKISPILYNCGYHDKTKPIVNNLETKCDKCVIENKL